MGSKKNIPEGWLDYCPIGKQIPGTVVICFKVPLKEEISRGVPEAQRFTPSMLMRKAPNLAGIIDVTNTTRYYNKEVFLGNGILHEKILCPGHVVPPATVVQCFQKSMQKMWGAAESAGGKLVGVHCTHGINRTGYLVCRYLIECRGFHPEDAIRLFAESRGHGIERSNYLSDLRKLLPGFRNPSSMQADFLMKEEQRRLRCLTDAHPCDGTRTRRDHRRPPPPVGDVVSRLPPSPSHPLPTFDRHRPPPPQPWLPSRRGASRDEEDEQRSWRSRWEPPHPRHRPEEEATMGGRWRWREEDDRLPGWRPERGTAAGRPDHRPLGDGHLFEGRAPRHRWSPPRANRR